VQSYHSLKATAKDYTHDDFITGVYMIDLPTTLSISSVFRRGLPDTTYLQNPSFAQVLQEVLQAGDIVVPGLHDQPRRGFGEKPLRKYFEHGWLHNEVFSPTEALYTFLSPLHMRYVQWMLLGNLDNGVISENSIVDFILAVICKFIPFNLSARRTFGATTQSTPEAQF
jgi:hypothetical protein